MKNLLIFGFSLFVAFAAADIVIRPNPQEAKYSQFSNATIRFSLSPWPPPCCKWNQSEGELYKDVLLELFVDPSSGQPRKKLCEVKYEIGVWNDQTGKCSNFELRMEDFYPDLADGVSFILTQATVDDQGPVTLQISYQDRNPSDFVDLVITDNAPPPNITAFPNTELNEGDTVELRCSVTNCSPPPSQLQWRKRADNGFFVAVDPKEIELADVWVGESYNLIEVGPVTWRDHARLYQCTVTNEVSSAENSYGMVVKHKPSITLGPCEQTNIAYRVIESRSIPFDCDVSAYPAADNNTLWKKNDAELVDQNHREFRIVSASRQDSGVYTCSVSNTLGSGTGSCTIDVLYGSTITLDKDDFLIKEGESTTVVCSVDANPKEESILWLFDNDKDFKVNSTILELTNIQPQHSGSYTCQSENVMLDSAGFEQRHTGRRVIKITVEYKPRWTTYAWTKYSAEESTTAQLQCHSNAYPLPIFYWMRNGVNVTSQSSSDTHVSNLTLENVKSDQFGIYECHVVNAMGASQFDVELRRPGKPDPPQACSTIEVSAYEIKLSCVNGYDGGRSIWFEAESNHGGIDTEAVIESNMASTITLSGMDPNTNYTVKLFALNEHGRSDGYLVMEVRTGDGVPVPKDPGPDIGAICGGVFGTIAIILMIVAFVILYRRSRKNNPTSDVKYQATKKKPDQDLSISNPTYTDDYGCNYDYSYDKRKPKDIEIYESESDEEVLPTIAEGKPDLWEINRDQLQMHNFIGEGQFTNVWGAYMTKHNMRNGALVAVKLIKGAKASDRENLLTEIQLMKTLDLHPNILSLLACSTKYEPVMMVMEYASGGRLLDYLRQLRQGRTSLTLAHLTACAAQVVNAMHYVSSLKLIHKDLAARSVLLDSNLICKLTDFTVQSSSAPNEDQTRIALRWMAPEWLFRDVHTSMSDVFSLGVLLWEIITLGSTPWPGYAGRQVSEALRGGQRMPAPPACPPRWYDIMCECWRQNPVQRPSWDILRDSFDEDLSMFHSRPNHAMPVAHLMANATDVMKNMPGEKC